MRWLYGIMDSMDMKFQKIHGTENSGRQWRMGKPGVLQSMGSQRVRHNLVTKQQPSSN